MKTILTVGEQMIAGIASKQRGAFPKRKADAAPVRLEPRLIRVGAFCKDGLRVYCWSRSQVCPLTSFLCYFAQTGNGQSEEARNVLAEDISPFV